MMPNLDPDRLWDFVAAVIVSTCVGIGLGLVLSTAYLVGLGY